MELRLAGIKKSFEGKEVLKGLDFTFEKGKIYGLLGRNGAGKTTLFNILADEIKAEEGKAYLTVQEEERPIRPKDLSYVYSTPVLPDFLTGYEFIKFFVDLHKNDIDNLQQIDAYFEDHIIIFSTHILQLATDLCDEIAILHDGKMSMLDHDRLGDETFEEEIIRLLKEESHGA